MNYDISLLATTEWLEYKNNESGCAALQLAA